MTPCNRVNSPARFYCNTDLLNECFDTLGPHRVMVQVQSTWFPIIDRNPQTFVPNIFEARAGDFKAATHRIYRSAQYPSRVTIPVVVKTP